MAKLMFRDAKLLGKIRALTRLRGDIVCHHGNTAECAIGSLVFLTGDAEGRRILEEYRYFMLVPRCFKCGHVNLKATNVYHCLGTTVAIRLREIGFVGRTGLAVLDEPKKGEA